MTTRARMGLFLALVIYIPLAYSGVHYGLPHRDHLLSYDCDETTWLEALSHIKPSKLNPAPELITPTFYLELYGATVLAAARIGWVPLHKTKEWFREHPDVFGRFYLAGRYLQIVCGILLLVLMAALAATLWNWRVAMLSVLWMAVTPSFIATSHFSQANLPVALLAFAALSCFLLDEHRSGEPAGWFLAGAFLSGLAISTKYSAFPLLILVAYACRFRLRQPKVLVLALVSILAGLFVGTPFAFLAPKIFFGAFRELSQANLLPVQSNWWSKLSFPLALPYRHAMGLGLEIVGAAALVMELIRTRGKSILGIWAVAFYSGAVAAGYIASPGRVLIVVPAFVLLAARALDRFMLQRPLAGWIIVAGIFIGTLLPTLTLVRLHRQPPAQEAVSTWIEQVIPRDRSIGIPRSIYWWTPPVVYSSAHHPERMDNPYRVIVLNFSVQETTRERPDYILLSGAEKTNEGNQTADRRAFLTWLDSGIAYQKLYYFPRDLHVGPYRWNRPESLFYTDDDLWSPSFEIFKRRERAI